jgi:hypothetical protein
MGGWQAEWDAITAEGRDVQQEALENPQPADADTRELLRFLQEERARRAA